MESGGMESNPNGLRVIRLVSELVSTFDHRTHTRFTGWFTRQFTGWFLWRSTERFTFASHSFGNQTEFTITLSIAPTMNNVMLQRSSGVRTHLVRGGRSFLAAEGDLLVNWELLDEANKIYSYFSGCWKAADHWSWMMNSNESKFNLEEIRELRGSPLNDLRNGDQQMSSLLRDLVHRKRSHSACALWVIQTRDKSAIRGRLNWWV